MSFRPKYLAHVNVQVRDAERSHAWYADLLGLHTYDYRPGRAASCRPIETNRTNWR